jgi:hypothetical protein
MIQDSEASQAHNKKSILKFKPELTNMSCTCHLNAAMPRLSIGAVVALMSLRSVLRSLVR